MDDCEQLCKDLGQEMKEQTGNVKEKTKGLKKFREELRKKRDERSEKLLAIHDQVENLKRRMGLKKERYIVDYHDLTDEGFEDAQLQLEEAERKKLQVMKWAMERKPALRKLEKQLGYKLEFRVALPGETTGSDGNGVITVEKDLASFVQASKEIDT